MKFEFDHKTGMMKPKKDDNIYFAQSQGGGLIVDDKKNNIKYIIERGGGITKLFGSFDEDSLNFYDMRDSRIISDRVIRLLGRDHKYSDYHYFLKGYHIGESFVQKMDVFLNESVWSDIRKRSTGEIRKEDGRQIGILEDGTRLIIGSDAFEDGELVNFDDTNFYLLENRIPIAVITDDSTDVYYRYEKDSEGPINMIRCFDADESLRTDNDFARLRAMMCQGEWDDDNFDDLKVDVSSYYVKFNLGWCEFLVYENRDLAIDDAIDAEESFLDSEETFDKKTIEHYRNVLGDDFFDTKEIEDSLRESQESYYDDLREDEAIEELIRMDLIELSEEYFELDENGDIDQSMPKFDYTDYKDKYVDKYFEGIGDIVDYYVMSFGSDGLKGYVDTRKLAELIVQVDGPESMLSGYDGEEREEKVDYVTYYIYRTQ